MTVSFNGLGNEGRLGNQMFQYAFMRGMSKKHGYDFIIPDANANRFDNYGLFECFELEGCKTGEGSYPTLECRDTAFNQKFLDECTDNTNYSGVFQTMHSLQYDHNLLVDQPNQKLSLMLYLS